MALWAILKSPLIIGADLRYGSGVPNATGARRAAVTQCPCEVRARTLCYTEAALLFAH